MDPVDEQLSDDLRLFGVAFWKLVNGERVRIDPRDIRLDADGIPTQTNVDYRPVIFHKFGGPRC